MRVKIIGGHGGVAPGSLTTSYLIDDKLLIDAGSVAHGISIEAQLQIDHILISHSHLDHIQDLAYLADNCFGMKGRPFEIYGSQEAITNTQTYLMNDKIWPDFSKLPNSKAPTVHFNILQSLDTILIGDYAVTPVPVNHPAGGHGFIIEHEGVALLFTQDTGPTEEIWRRGKSFSNLKAIFSEISFPENLSNVARDSCHHTPQSFQLEMQKMPDDIPLFVGHLKPHFQNLLIEEIKGLGEERISILKDDGVEFLF